jgi:hypothetical protein
VKSEDEFAESAMEVKELRTFLTKCATYPQKRKSREQYSKLGASSGSYSFRGADLLKLHPDPLWGTPCQRRRRYSYETRVAFSMVECEASGSRSVGVACWP